MQTYKAFNPNMTCSGFKYEVGKTYRIDGPIEACVNGFHACLIPLDVWDYYPPKPQTRYAFVEQGGEIKTDIDKTVSSGITIKSPLDLDGLINAQVERVSGYKAHSAPTGDCAHSATMGYKAHSATTGNWARSVTTGDEAHSVTRGNWAHSVTTGYAAHSATIGDEAHSVTTGNWAYSTTTGYKAHSVTRGNWAHSVTTGYAAHSVTMGYKAHSAATGENAIAASIGEFGRAEAAKGSWIVLAEYDDQGNILYVKSAKVTGRKLKPNTFYRLKGGNFIEVE